MGQILFAFNQGQKQKRIYKQKFSENPNVISLRQCGNWTEILLINKQKKLIDELILVQCQINDEHFKMIFETVWPNLHQLCLCKNQITGRGLSWLFDQSLDNLTDLNLSNNPIDNRGIKYLIKVYLPNLIKLDINDCLIGDEGYKHLTKARWPRLSIIDLRNNKKKHHYPYENNYKNLKQLWITQKQAINCLTFILLESQQTKINKHFSAIPNKNIEKIIYNILKQKIMMDN